MSSIDLSALDGLLWDMDGVIIDESRSCREAIRMAAQYFCSEIEVTPLDVENIKKISGLNNDWDASFALIKKLTESDFDIENLVSHVDQFRKQEAYQKIQRVHQAYYLGNNLYQEYYGESSPLDFDPGLIASEKLLIAANELKALKKKYKKMVIVTGRPWFEANHTLETHHIKDFFDLVVAMEDTEKGKPAPDPIVHAIKKMNLKNTLYIGDTINDVEAAQKANIPVILISYELNRKADLRFSNSEELVDVLMKKRKGAVKRDTFETQIDIDLALDGQGKSEIDTGIGFFDHMLDLLAKHGHFDLKVKVNGDLHVDDHHTVEDIGIVIGKIFGKAIGDKKGINRYGFFMLPMDECLTTVAFDFSGRYAFNLVCDFNREMVGELSTEMVYEFWDAFAQNARASLIIKSEFGRNDHHKIEGIFKAAAKAINIACSKDVTKLQQIPSSKGKL